MQRFLRRPDPPGPQPRDRALEYEKIRALPGGGFGDVSLARRAGPYGFEKVVVIKSSRPGNEDSRRALIDEIRAYSRLRHRNIVDVLDVYEETINGEERPCMVLEYCECSLHKLLQCSENRRVEPALAAHLAMEICAALGHAHENGIVHRDIKLGNILLTKHGELRLIDFGIAKWEQRLFATTQTRFKGSLPYSSPEQVRNDENIDGRSDLWSVGIVLYELLTGRQPFTSDETSQLQHFREMSTKIQTDPTPELPGYVRDGLKAVVYKLLQKRPKDRYSEASEVIADLAPIAVREWTARRELSHHVFASEHVATRKPLIGADSNTVPLRAEDRPPATFVAMKLDMSSDPAMKLTTDSDSHPALEVPSTVFVDQEMATPSPYDPRAVDTETMPGEDIPLRAAPHSIRRPRLRFVHVASAIIVMLAITLALRESPGSGAAHAKNANTEHATPPRNMPSDEVKAVEPKAIEAVESILASDVAAEPNMPSSEAHQQRPTPTTPARSTAALRASLSVDVDSDSGGFISLDGRTPRRAPAEYKGLKPGLHVVRAGLSGAHLTQEQRVMLSGGSNSVRIDLDNPFGALAK